MLSTIVVSLGTWGFATWRDSVQHRREAARTIERLDEEIESRFHLDGSSRFPDSFYSFIEAYPPVLSLKEIESIQRKLVLPPPPEQRVYDEYANRSTLSLMRELSALLPFEERRCVVQAIRAVQSLNLPPRDEYKAGTPRTVVLEQLSSAYTLRD